MIFFQIGVSFPQKKKMTVIDFVLTLLYINSPYPFPFSNKYPHPFHFYIQIPLPFPFLFSNTPSFSLTICRYPTLSQLLGQFLYPNSFNIEIPPPFPLLFTNTPTLSLFCIHIPPNLSIFIYKCPPLLSTNTHHTVSELCYLKIKPAIIYSHMYTFISLFLL